MPKVRREPPVATLKPLPVVAPAPALPPAAPPAATFALPVAPVTNAPSRVDATTQLNHGKNVSWTPKFAFRPGPGIDALADTIKWINANLGAGVKIKAGGSKHSWSPVAVTDGAYIQPQGITFISAPTDVKPGVPTAGLAEIGSGTTIREINARLWAQGQALPVLGGYDGQTLGGVLPTGTHGSVLKSGSLADGLIRQVNLVTADGSKVRIEPKNGITDPKAFAADHPGWKLIQDDDYFGAAKINIGTLGVVHSYVIETVPRFWLDETRTQTTFDQAKQVLAGENIYRLMEHDGPSTGAPSRTFDPKHPVPAHHLELLWNVHTGKMVVTTRQPVDAATAAGFEKNEPAAFANPPGRDLFRGLTTDQKYERPTVATWLTENFGKLASDASKLVEKLIPSSIPGVVDAGMNTLGDDHYINRSYNVYNIGDGANQLPAQSGTLSVPLKNDEYLKAMDVIKAVAAKMAAQGKYEDGPISIRFKKGLAPPEGSLLGDREDRAEFELIFSGDDPKAQANAKEFVNAYYDALHAAFGDDVGVHFGQLYPDGAQDPARTEGAHPGLERFNQIRHELDPLGRFTNDFQKRLLG